MGLYFHNKTGSPVWVVYAHHAPDCEGSAKWSKKGWYKIFPGNTAKVWSGWAGGEKFFYFAEDEAGHSWAGEFFTQVPSNAFEWCWDTSSTTSRTLGLRKQVVVDAFPPSVQDHTINLVV
jgi:uncharacterized protein DUF1036